MKKAKKTKSSQKKTAPKTVKHRAPVTKKSAPKSKAVARLKASVVTPVDAPPKKLKLSKEQIANYKGRLLDLRDHVIDGVNFLASDNLKRSHREASGELSGYSLHMADAGTDNFDREFALSLVSNEQDAIYEIEEALTRLEHGTYGICEMCEKPIRKERLEAVPFARLCVQCQSTVEKDRRRPGPALPVFSEQGDEDSGDSDDSED